MKERVLAVIPARGGSKGLHGKNIRPLLGKPLIAWTIEQAKMSDCIDKIVVSTDSKEIARISEQYGAEVPFLRPPSLAADEAKSIDVIYHALDYFEKNDDYYDILILLEPTSPLREIEDINMAIRTLNDHPTAQSIVGVAKCEFFHPEFIIHINQDGFIRKINGGFDFDVIRRQELSNYYFFEGSLYVSYVKALKEKGTFYHEFTIPYVVKRYQAPEVDELSDFICIEALMKAKMEGRI
jgi:N-acylneuraminate cytidylyltransferase/CMP-N,N'-diacetyllegionaminic acid synthase